MNISNATLALTMLDSLNSSSSTTKSSQSLLEIVTGSAVSNNVSTVISEATKAGNIEAATTMTQTTESKLSSVSDIVSQMQDLSSEYNNTSDETEQASLTAQFKALQAKLGTSAGRYNKSVSGTEASYLNVSVSKLDSDLYSLKSSTTVGYMVESTKDDSGNSSTSTETVSWSDITDMSISDSDASSKLKVAANYLSDANSILSSNKALLASAYDDLMSSSSTLSTSSAFNLSNYISSLISGIASS